MLFFSKNLGCLPNIFCQVMTRYMAKHQFLIFFFFQVFPKFICGQTATKAPAWSGERVENKNGEILTYQRNQFEQYTVHCTWMEFSLLHQLRFEHVKHTQCKYLRNIKANRINNYLTQKGTTFCSTFGPYILTYELKAHHKFQTPPWTKDKRRRIKFIFQQQVQNCYSFSLYQNSDMIPMNRKTLDNYNEH